jgi:1-acyl-sn-glycerol-3-phosphate acyltransferase
MSIENSTAHQPSFFKKIWLMLATGAVVLNTAVKSIVRVRLNRMTRSTADMYIAEWARRMLKVVDLKINPIEFAQPINYQAQRCYIIMSNHSSHYDIPIIFQTLPGSIRMMAKKELFKIPLFGRMLRENEFPSIDRENRKQAIKDLEVAEKIMRSGIVLWVAPEGTRSRHPSYLGTFKKGGFILALKSQAVIIPVGIRGSANILPSHTWNFSSGETVEVHVGNPIDTTRFTDKDQLLEYVENEISALAHVPKFSEHQ